MIPNRQQAYDILTKYTHSPDLVKHALCVEGTMRHFARLAGADEELWGVVGLLHDVDYDQYPEEHCKKAVELLKAEGVDDSVIHSVCSHGYGLCCDVAPESEMEKTLYTVDELTGIINAAALVRPSKSVMDMELKSLKKKFKDKKFVAGCNRDVIRGGCELLGKELDWVMAEALEGMKEVADQVGLGMAE